VLSGSYCAAAVSHTPGKVGWCRGGRLPSVWTRNSCRRRLRIPHEALLDRPLSSAVLQPSRLLLGRAEWFPGRLGSGNLSARVSNQGLGWAGGPQNRARTHAGSPTGEKAERVAGTTVERFVTKESKTRIEGRFKRLVSQLLLMAWIGTPFSRKGAVIGRRWLARDLGYRCLTYLRRRHSLLLVSPHTTGGGKVGLKPQHARRWSLSERDPTSSRWRRVTTRFRSSPYHASDAVPSILSV
jgi:hypothetical protein